MRSSLRDDGRRADQLRPIVVQRDYLKFAAGSALISAGNTSLLCACSLEEGVPEFLKGTGRGWLTAEYGMLPASTPTRKQRETAARVDGRTMEIRRLIGRALRGVVDAGKLGERTLWLDCDVIQADGGTRTLGITGAWIALALAAKKLLAQKRIPGNPLLGQLAAVSVGYVAGRPMLDLTYREDSKADVDMNVVLTGAGEFIELQGTAEHKPFTDKQLGRMLRLARGGCKRLMSVQRAVLRARHGGRVRA